jgi:hypothetical protein
MINKRIKQDIQKVCDTCCDDMTNVTSEHVGKVFEWLIKNNYIIYKISEQPTTKLVVGEDDVLEYNDGNGTWYPYTKLLQKNKYFHPFDIRLIKK